jgi:hypothetical protein
MFLKLREHFTRRLDCADSLILLGEHQYLLADFTERQLVKAAPLDGNLHDACDKTGASEAGVVAAYRVPSLLLGAIVASVKLGDKGGSEIY